jgi:hypothetical protein
MGVQQAAGLLTDALETKLKVAHKLEAGSPQYGVVLTGPFRT